MGVVGPSSTDKGRDDSKSSHSGWVIICAVHGEVRKNEQRHHASIPICSIVYPPIAFSHCPIKLLEPKLSVSPETANWEKERGRKNPKDINYSSV